ncbi:MAG: holin [Clostridia bacterium]|nr:holin [Clostridia bacterium]
MEKISAGYNAAMGAVMAIIIQIFGSHNHIFGIYILLNILDWLTGWYKARKKKELSSKIGFKGVVKKLGYWILRVMQNCRENGYDNVQSLIQQNPE